MRTIVVAPPAVRQIQVWFGKHAFIDHLEPDPVEAAVYEAAMRRQFASCRVTNTPYSAAPSGETPAGGPSRP
ncbi:hypothetical protein GCM10009789_83490 [Kribbella sancticallisti]|uniref:Uncharacterized protein n=1 Tax=Kribbella sancticallisti TaxID=460087 RepID=A0ABN2ESW0_9ACTN